MSTGDSSFEKKAEETDDGETEFELALTEFKPAQAEVDREYRRFHEHLESTVPRTSVVALSRKWRTAVAYRQHHLVAS